MRIFIFRTFTCLLAISIMTLFSSCESVTTIVGLGSGKERLLVIKQLENSSEIGTMLPDGTDYNKLFGFSNQTPNSNIRYAELSPDRNQITFSGGPNDSQEGNSVWLADIKGNLIERISFKGRRPMWSGDGSKIYYTEYRHDMTYLSDVYVFDFTSIQKIDIPPGSECSNYDYCNYYYWLGDVSPFSDNYIIANELFEYQDVDGLRQGIRSLILFNMTTNDKEYITDSTFSKTGWANISPVDSILLFNSSDSINSKITHLYLSDLLGKNKQEISDPLEQVGQGSFCWSPDGKFIALSKQNLIDNDQPWSNLFVKELSSGIESQITFQEDRVIGWYVVQWFENEL